MSDGEQGTVRCARCGQERTALAANPFRSGAALIAVGDELRAKVCKDCYGAWVQGSVRMVNELKLDLRDSRGQHVWIEQMRGFLNLGGSTDPWRRFVNRRARIETTSGVLTVGTVVGADDEKLWVADFDGGEVPRGFAPVARGAEGASGSASILRDCVLTIEEAPQ
jgi:Fe-S cluster biosynthesis and repair protein YggX